MYRNFYFSEVYGKGILICINALKFKRFKFIQ